MNSRTILQVPMSKELKLAAEKIAHEEGFSSLQETIRVLLNKFVKREVGISFTSPEKPETIKLSSAAKRRYKKMVEEIKQGKNITHTTSLKELFDLLEK